MDSMEWNKLVQMFEEISKVCYNPKPSWQLVLPTMKLPSRNVHSTPCIVVDKLWLHYSLARYVR
jgi:hypothetical protein